MQSAKVSRFIDSAGVRGRFLYLLIAIVLVIVIRPERAVLRDLLLLFIPFAGIYASGTNRKLLTVAIILAVPTVAITVIQSAGVIGRSPWIFWVNLSFYIFVVVMLTYSIWHTKKVTADTLYGGISVYLLLGLIWAAVYTAIETLTPGSISADPEIYGRLEFDELLYFSYVTLTTLGYGDILPITPMTRSLAVLESTAGVLFLGTLIARLVSLYSQE